MATRQSNTDTPDTQTNEHDGFLGISGKTAAIVGIIVVIIIGGVFLYRQNVSSKNEEAVTALSRIRPYYDRGEYELAINGDPSKSIGGEKIRGLRSVVEEWGSTPAGKIAALLLGNCYMAIGQPAKASESFEAAAGADDELVSAPAHAGLAAVAETSGKYEAAAQAYEKAAADDRLELNTPQYLINAARNYERAGKSDAAKEDYRKVATQFPLSPANAQARLALARFNVEL